VASIPQPGRAGAATRATVAGSRSDRVGVYLRRCHQRDLSATAGIIQPARTTPQLDVANASISKLLVGRGGLHLSSFNEHSQLEQVGPGSTIGLISYRSPARLSSWSS